MITILLPAPATCHNVQKFVTLLMIPVITAVPGFAEVLRILPVHKRLPVIACTLHQLRVNLSIAPGMLSVENVIVNPVSVRACIGVANTSPHGAHNALQLHDKNFQLFGKVSVHVTFVWLPVKSSNACSSITIFDNVVRHVHKIELAAISAEIFVPPVAAVINTPRGDQ